MSRDNICRKCSLSVDPKIHLFTVCEGDCALSYHADCVFLSENDVLALKANIIWLCDNCLKIFRRARDSRNCTEEVATVSNGDVAHNGTQRTTIEDEVRDLKTAVADIMQTMAKLVPGDSTIDPPVLSSTPVSSMKLLDGTNGTNVCCRNENDDAGLRWQCADDDRNFSLLLTNIDASAAERDVRRMVVGALGTDALDPECMDIVKLVPWWKSQNSFDFVSYKVVLDKRWKTKAMDPSTWPKGVRFREFVRKRISTWKPV